MKDKVRIFNRVIKTNFSDDKIAKEKMHYICIACITTDSVMRKEKKELSTNLFRRMQIQNGKYKDDEIHKG